ncbi:DUF1656 domain-containing protein [Chelatococcus sp. GCM10030263]|jgi:hypothetical protein|uniref:DUF1656 domain-containing protein n=1 Tax=Chelatococcus sp. GCM10030263 TaxID=3273387 RepID=UPI0036087CB9
MPEEIDIYGVYIPGLLALMFVTYVVSIAVRRVLAWTGAYALVWHRGLFDVALYVILLGAMFSFTRWLWS